MRLFSSIILVGLALAIDCNAQQGYITAVYPDMKGNTFLVIGEDQASTIYNIADGKALGKWQKDDLELPAKVLRYKLRTAEGMWGGQTRDDISRDQNGYTTAFKKNGEVVAQIAFNSADDNSFDVHNGSPLIGIITHPNKGHQANVYVVDTKAGGPGQMPEKKLLATYNTDKSYSTVSVSPKGMWIFDGRNFVLVEVATGKVHQVAGEFYNHVTFSADETKLMYGTANEVVVVETATGKEIEKLAVPKSLIKAAKKDKVDYCARPLSDGKSFVYRALYGTATPAWLVSGDTITELKE